MTKKWKQADRLVATYLRSGEKEIHRAYVTALKEIRNHISLAYERYGGDFVSMQKYQRLLKLEQQIGQELRIMTIRTSAATRKAVGKTFAQSYYTTGWIFESEIQARIGFGLLPAKQIEAAIYSPFDPLKWSERLRNSSRLLNEHIRGEITQGLIQGKSYQQTASAVRERLLISEKRALRIVRTETHRAQVQGRLDGFEQARDAGVDFRLQWVATLDSRTRDSHQDMDGQIAERIDEQDIFTSSEGVTTTGPGLSGVPEFDINCRCSTIAVIDGFEATDRRARDPATGKGEMVPNMTYHDWAELKGVA